MTVASGKSFSVGGTAYQGGDLCSYSATAADRKVPQTASWVKDTVEYHEEGKDITLTRAAWAPEGADSDSGKNPLIIWLHGMGEAGVHIGIALHIGGNGVPEGPGIPGLLLCGQGQVLVIKGAVAVDIHPHGRGLHRQDIGADQPVGGKVLLHVGLVLGGQGQQVKDYNIWFVQSADDGTVNPSEYGLPTYVRLLEAGAQNVWFTLSDHVRGTDDPEPWSWTGTGTYDGHWSWTVF